MILLSSTRCAPAPLVETSLAEPTAALGGPREPLAPSASAATPPRSTSSSHAGAVTRPTRVVWGEITRDERGVVWIEQRIEILPALIEAAAGADWAGQWLGVQADMELEIGAAPCVQGAACPLGRCRLQVEKVVSIRTFDGKPEWQRPSPKRPTQPSALPGVVEPPDFAEEDARRCARDCNSRESTCDDRWTSCVENCLLDMFPPSGTSTR